MSTKKQTKSETTIPVTQPELETLAKRLDAIAAEATALGEDAVVKKVGIAAKSCRFAGKQRAARLARVATLVSALQAKGLTAEQIVAKLTGTTA